MTPKGGTGWIELILAVSALKAPVSLQTRVGIATGLVVVGDLIGSGEAQERGIVGETPNLAARLQGIAEQNTVVIAERTRKLLAIYSSFTTSGLETSRALRNRYDLGPRCVQAGWRPVRGAAHGDDDARRSRRGDRASDTRVGAGESCEGSAVLISGETGIGKSRLAEAMQEQLATEPHTRFRFFCSPYHQDSALYPAIAQLKRAAGFRREDPAERRLTKLEALLAQATNDISGVAPLFADLLSIPTGDRYPALALTPQKRKEKTLQALIAESEGSALRHPVLMIFEDIHWSDPTTRELLDLLIERVPKVRLLRTDHLSARVLSGLGRPPLMSPFLTLSSAATRGDQK